MPVQYLPGTRYIKSPEYRNGRFDDPDAQAFWQELPDNLKEIALAELAVSNCVEQLLRNDERNIVLLAFDRGPLTEIPESDHLQVHRSHSYGNYCYDGTSCTIEDLPSGCFLVFDDPDWSKDAP